MTAEREPQRIAPQRLLETLARHCQTDGENGRTALLVVMLNRTDRLLSLAQDASNPLVLAEIARRVQSMLRADDRYAFVANDELWVMLANLPGESLGELGGKTLRESLTHPIVATRSDGSRTIVQCRPVIGGAWTPRRVLGDPMAMVAAAAEACAGARTQENQVLIAKLEDDAAWLRRDELEKEVRAALFANELDVYFQPQIELATRDCVAAEALLRWTRADGSKVNPALVASVCEERGMIGQLTQYVLNNALRHQKQWARQGFDIPVSINVTAATLADTTFPMLVSHALSTWRVEGDRLSLELTEGAILQNEHSAASLLKHLRDLGCQLSIDDFGTGYSSLSWLKQLPLNELKIDRSFVREIERSGTRAGRSARALIDLAHAFGMRALAEGVESAREIHALTEAGCDRLQGFSFSPALAPPEFLAWMRRHRSSDAGPPAFQVEDAAAQQVEAPAVALASDEMAAAQTTAAPAEMPSASAAQALKSRE